MSVALPGLAPIAGRPALIAEAERQIKEAFESYEQHLDPGTGAVTQANPMTGIELKSIRLTDTDGAIALTVKFDSLQVAEMNVIRLLDKTTIDNIVLAEGMPATNLTTGVAYPELRKNAPAGFINARKAEVGK